MLGSLPTLIVITYFIDVILGKSKLERVKVFVNYFLKMFLILLTIYCIYLSTKTLYSYIKIAKEYTELNHFKYIIQPERSNRANKGTK